MCVCVLWCEKNPHGPAKNYPSASFGTGARPKRSSSVPVAGGKKPWRRVGTPRENPGR